jgi:hypothetical protein
LLQLFVIHAAAVVVARRPRGAYFGPRLIFDLS